MPISSSTTSICAMVSQAALAELVLPSIEGSRMLTDAPLCWPFSIEIRP